MARQCPRCELRFLTDVEVREHLIADHKMAPEQLEQPYPLPGRTGSRSRGRGSDGRQSGEQSPSDDEPEGRGRRS